jgi:mRNA-degrading endonuclease YafQ of YafQ-DinJ toxin-antitoxin module
MDQPFPPTLKNHGLTGKLRGLRAISAGYDLRVVYEEEGGHATVLLLNTGSHDEVY